MDGRLALGPSQEGALVLYPLPHLPEESGPLNTQQCPYSETVR